jgi:hypothetical protein
LIDGCSVLVIDGGGSVFLLDGGSSVDLGGGGCSVILGGGSRAPTFFFLFGPPSFEKLGDLATGSVHHTHDIAVRGQHKSQKLLLQLR